MIEVMTIGGGEELRNTLNSIVMVVGESSFTTLAKLAMVYGVMFALVHIAVGDQAFKQLFKWFIGSFLFFNCIVVPRTDVYITDSANPAYTGVKVGNVPYGLAYLIQMYSATDYGFGRGVDLAFSMSDDISYHKSGILLGNSIIRQSSMITATNPVLAANMKSFMQNCVLFDLQVQKITYNELISTEDLWSFVSNAEANVESRMFNYSGNMLTCKAGVAKLNTDLGTETTSAVGRLASIIYPGRDTLIARQQLASALPTSYETLLGVSQNAEDVVKQSMMIKPLKYTQQLMAMLKI